MVRLVSVPQHAVDRATEILQEGIDGAAKILDELDQIRPGITESIANLLGMANVRQTRRMASAIIANALVFHDQIAGMHAKIKSLAQACGDSVDNPQGEVLAAWTAILKINYWPIFSIAKDILRAFGLRRRGPNTAATAVYSPGRQRNRRRKRPRPHWPHFPEARCRPQVLGHLLHTPCLRRTAGPARRRQAGGGRLVERRRNWQSANR